MNIKNITLSLLVISTLTLANEISQSGVATADSKTDACQQALLQAQKEALHQSGINIFTSFESKTTMTNDEVTEVFNDINLQKSYGYIGTISKKEKAKYNQNTGYITCEVDGIFEVDTSKLKSQLLAMSQKYDNEYEDESGRARALKEKNELMQKYFLLKDNITNTQKILYKDTYNCGDSLGLNECKVQLKKNIRSFTKKELSNKYDIESSLIKMDDIELINEIIADTTNGLEVKYDGIVEVKASSVKNPYIDEINSLNAFLGEEEIVDKIEEPKGPSLGEKFSKKMDSIGSAVGDTIGDIGNSVLERNYFLYYTGFGAGDFLIDWAEYDGWDSHYSTTEKEDTFAIEMYLQVTPNYPYWLKLSYGEASYKYSKSYNRSTEVSHKKYTYNFTSIGISYGGFLDKGNIGAGLNFDLDCVLPNDVSGTSRAEWNSEILDVTKINPFINGSANFFLKFPNHVMVSVGLQISNEDAFSGSWILFKAGLGF